jgi:hypothetical protein
MIPVFILGNIIYNGPIAVCMHDKMTFSHTTNFKMEILQSILKTHQAVT